MLPALPIIDRLESRQLLAAATFNTFPDLPGRVTVDAGADSPFVMTVQSDGKIVAAGSSDSALSLIRLNADGSLDTSFGDGGIVTEPTVTDRAEAIILQGDRIIVGTTIRPSPSEARFGLLRYDSHGVRDTTFGEDGLVATPVVPAEFQDPESTFSGPFTWVSDLAISPDGDIVAVGSIWPSPGSQYGSLLAIARYDADGHPDLAFSDDGTLAMLSGTNGTWGATAEFQGDHLLVAAGSNDGADENDWALFRFNADGTLDDSFGDHGASVLELPGTSYEPRDMKVLPDGKILIAGDTQTGFFNVETDDSTLTIYNIFGQNTFARLNADGSLDTTFGSDGVLADPRAAMSVMRIAVNQDGSFYAVGSRPSGLGVAAYQPDGDRNDAFGDHGVAIVKFDERGCEGVGIDLAPDDTIVVLGAASANDYSIAKLNPDGSYTPGFGGAGYTSQTPDSANVGTASLKRGLLTITGTSDSDLIKVRRQNQKIIVIQNRVRREYAASTVRRITIRTGEGDDVVLCQSLPDLPVRIEGGNGNDQLSGSGGNDTLLGGPGEDQLAGGGGSDAVSGGDGVDSVAGGRGNDTINGGGDDDVLLGGGDGDTLNGGAGDDRLDGGIGHDRLIGADGDDYYVHASGDAIVGLSADDAKVLTAAQANSLYSARFGIDFGTDDPLGPAELITGRAIHIFD